MPEPALVLVAHGSRDPRWAAPLEALAHHLRRQQTAPVVLAFLDYMKPLAADAIDGLVADGAQRVAVVPALLGAGRHTRQDMPPLVAEAQARHPSAEITLAPALGQSDAVLEAIAAAVPKLLAGK